MIIVWRFGIQSLFYCVFSIDISTITEFVLDNSKVKNLIPNEALKVQHLQLIPGFNCIQFLMTKLYWNQATVYATFRK